MAMDATALAEEIKEAIGQSPEPTSKKNKEMAKDIVNHLKTAIVNHAIPGSVTGTAGAPGGPLANGAATGGVITLVPADLIGRFVATFGISTPEIIGMATAITTHVMTGLVEFASGTITGTCTHTPLNPGPLVGGAGSGGEITGLEGSTLATLMASLMAKPGASEELEKMCTAIVDHISSNAEVTYTSGTVTATCPAGGGPIAAGIAAVGTIS